MDLIHLQPLLGLKLLLVVLYVCVWYGINKCFHFINQNDQIRLELVTAFFYCTLPLILAFILIYQFIIGDNEYWPIHIHIVLGGVAFYLFSLIEEFRLKDKYEWDVVFHHIIFGTFFFAFTVNLNCILIWSWLPAIQCSGIFYSLGKAISKHKPTLYARIRNHLEIMNFWFFLSSRIIFQTVLMIYLAQDILEEGFLTYLVVAAFFMSFILNVNWFAQITRRYLATKERIQLTNKQLL
jgi:hypothetical protein